MPIREFFSFAVYTSSWLRENFVHNNLAILVQSHEMKRRFTRINAN